ncbi:MAG: ferrous iron transport protein A [Rhizobiales bacterium]|jgi:ferrous iron transport protein A|nr:ferrous iron transport protein A [Hyphomicrobiales bacterium]
MSSDASSMNGHKTLAHANGAASPLGLAQRGFAGLIKAIAVGRGHLGISAAEIERRLLELGFVEGAAVQVLHEGPVGRDPIAVRVNGTTIALRRREAMAILVE